MIATYSDLQSSAVRPDLLVSKAITDAETGGTVTTADFLRAAELPSNPGHRFVLLAAPAPFSDRERTAWCKAAARLAAATAGKVCVELVLAQSRAMFDSPDVVVDAWRLAGSDGTGPNGADVGRPG